MSVADRLNERLRLTILTALRASPDFGLHEYLLLDHVRALGLGSTRETLRAQCEWLQALALISADRVEGALVLRLSGDGDDVAQGLQVVPGIARPRP